jgi:hypothetical protein
VLITILALLVGLALHSTWAAYQLTRSGRRPLACALCYVELYPPAAVLLIMSVQVAWQAVFWGASFSSQMPIALGSAAAFVTLAHVGVLRRWHPAARVAGYAAAVAVGVALTWAFGS